MERKSSSYVCTLDLASAADMEKLAIIRKTVATSNKYITNKKRVVIRGRKPIVKQTVTNYWTGKTGFRGFDWAGNVVGGLSNASKIDVYIYDRRP